MCGGLAKLLSPITSLLGGSETPAPSTPAVVTRDPKAEADAAAADAAQKTTTEKIAKRRRAVSLLATGGAGDTTLPSTTSTEAKSQLGA